MLLRLQVLLAATVACPAPQYMHSSDEWSPPRGVSQQCAGGDALRSCAAAKFGRACAVDRVPWGSLTPPEFKANHVDAMRPVIFTDAAEAFLARPAEWVSKKSFVEAFGALTVNVGTGAELAQFGGKNLFGSKPASLREVVDKLAAGSGTSEEDASGDTAVFDMRVMQQPELASSFVQPALFTDTFMNLRGARWNMLSLGGDGTGLGFHTHADTWLGLAAGAKRWLLFEPGRFPAHDPMFPNRMLSTAQLMQRWPGNSSDPDAAGSMPRPMECIQRAGDIMYLPAGWAHATENLGDTVGVGGQTQTCEPPEGCKSLINRLETAASAIGRRPDGTRVAAAGKGGDGDPEALRLISHAHLLVGQASKDRAREIQVMFSIERAFRLAPTMMGVAADVLNILVQDKDVLTDAGLPSKKAKTRLGLSRKQRAALKAQRAAEVASAEADGYQAVHPALTLTERTIIPVLEASALQGVSNRTLSASYWAVADVVGKLATQNSAATSEIRESARAVCRRLLRAGFAMDASDIRFPRELAIQAGHERHWDEMRDYLNQALTIEPNDPETVKMRSLLPG